ncbi:MAG: diphthine--ammonia ligase [Proteobacteria bacterium]|nr:diphthine--ammonia ligase [Pseudomonadota bacterium]MBU1687707.1 diphthine--ammonia ligase [Pseudomonadota bacterium]
MNTKLTGKGVGALKKTALSDTSLRTARFFGSWSGGKDSCLALYKAQAAGAFPAALLTMMVEDGARSRSHGLPLAVLKAQAEALGLPLMTRAATWNTYEEVFLAALAELKAAGLDHGVFGDIDLPPHREWVERVCAVAGVTPHLPLWLQGRRELLAEFLAAGFFATIVVVNITRLSPKFLGRTMDAQTIDDLERAGVDACGEEGEFHTVVTDGPIFSSPVPVRFGDILTHDGYAFKAVELVELV